MLVHPDFDPVAVSIGPLKVHWYGLTYLVAFGLFYALAAVRAAKPWFASRGWSRRDIEDMMFYGVMGVVLGGRLGYVLFYKPAYYLSHPLEIFAVWEGGMSFHGGLIGVLLAMALFSRMRRRHFFDVTDLIAPCVPLGLASGRVGNFINGELWGRAADPSLPWAMIFPHVDNIPRHPSQVYQFLLEGLLLFCILWWFARKERPLGQVSAVFLMGYGCFRFIAEYFREPDAFLGLRALNLSQGQWLCVPMVLAGIVIFWWSARRLVMAPAPTGT